MNFEEVKKIRAELKHTWRYYFRRFGRLLPVQFKAIPYVLNGENVILMSPTASGKTEAVMAPISELIISENLSKPNTMYICPTRALVYDIYFRLHHIIEDIGLSIAMRTGERRQFSEKDPQDIIITTPESLDSMLCRNNELLKSIRYIVLDELHLLHGNYRGDQLKLDLKRLEHITGSIQYCALSATFNDPDYVAKQYFSSYTLIKSSGARKINYKLFFYDGPVDLRETLEYCRRKKYRKLLFFCNSRAGTEVIADQIKKQNIWPKKNVFVHHGSLSKSERSDAEKALKFENIVICCATTTLEVGIDIGDIDATVLVEPPLSVSSLLQRIGRGNRRSDETITIGLYTSDEQFKEFKRLFERAERGEIEEIQNGPCLSVVVQQILSYLFEKRYSGVRKKDIMSLILQLPTREEVFKEILLKLIDDEYVVFHRGKYYPDTRLLDLARYGMIHANIPGGNELKVIDDLTGRPLGNIERLETINQDFMLSGKKWEVSSVGKNSIKVTSSSFKDLNPAKFPGVKLHGKYYTWLPPKAKRVCCDPVII